MILVTTLNIYSDQSLSWHQNTYLCYNMMFAFDVFFTSLHEITLNFIVIQYEVVLMWHGKL